MKVKPEEMPFRFYGKDERDMYQGNMPALYENYIAEMLKAYQEVGGDISQLSQFIELDENGNIKGVNMDRIIEDCKSFDDKMISTDDIEGALPEFKEDKYGLAGFLGRYTSIDKKDENDNLIGISHKDVGKKALENLNQIQGLEGEQKRINDSNKVLFAHLATTKFLARSTIVTAAQQVADGAMMQIGCSQGKTTVLAYASYIDMMKGMKVMNTSSNPGLVLDNLSEFIEPYELLGVAQDMCAITRDKDDKDIIVTREKLSDDIGITVQIDEDGNIKLPELAEVEKKKNPSEKEEEDYKKKLDKRNKFVEKLSKIFGEDFKNMSPEDQEKVVSQYLEKGILKERFSGCNTFEDKVGKMLSECPLVMADTMTLMKYDEKLPDFANEQNGVPSICMADEADCEFLDARPFEVTGKSYSEKSDKARFERRKLADSKIVEEMKKSPDGISMDSLKKISRESNIPLEFLVDAYEVRTSFTREGEDYVIKDGKMTTLNPNKRVLEQDTQGHEQAIYAMRANDGLGKDDKRPVEKEVVDVKYPYQVMGKYGIHSLISGTMEDRGLSKFKGQAESLYGKFSKAREKLFKMMGFRTPATKDVVDFRTVGPLTREDRGNVLTSMEETTTDEKGKIEANKEFSLGGKRWKDYIKDNEEALEEQWKKSVHKEIDRRKKEQPVLVSVPNVEFEKKLGGKEVEVFTDAHKPGEEMKKDGKMYFQKGQAYYMDDAYGRGYNSKFEGDNGHVLITALPDNSRNLEQFLFRVARGGDAGSSSMVISPTDPALKKFLEDMDQKINDGTIDLEQYKGLFDEKTWESIISEPTPKGLTDAYFTKLMQGKIPIDRLVFDMYPEKTIEIMNNMEAKGNYSKEFMDRIDIFTETKREQGMEALLVDSMEIALKKSKVRHLKTYSGEVMDRNSFIAIQKEAAVNVYLALAKNGRVLSEQEFAEIMPGGIDKEELNKLYNSVKDKMKTENHTNIDGQNEKKNMKVEPTQDSIEQAIADYELESGDILIAAQRAKEIGKEPEVKVTEGEEK